MLENLVINGVNFLVIVFGLVEFTKKMGVSGKTLTALSMVIGLVLGIAYQVATMYPEFSKWFGAAVFGLAVGLAACGIYDFLSGRLPKPDVSERAG